MKKIAILGECMIELNGELFGMMQQTYGGDTLNTATYLSRISQQSQLEVSYVSALGKDKLSQMLIEFWQADNIKTDWVAIDPMRQAGIYLIQLDQFGERSFSYWRNNSAARYFVQHSHFPAIMQQLKQVDLLYLSGISLAILPSQDRETLLETLADLKSQGVQIAFDSNYRPHLWENEQAAKKCYRQIFSIADIALVTFEDEQLLWKDQDRTQALQRLSAFDFEVLVIKEGKKGACYLENGELVSVPTNEVANVVDTTSAGDAFNAGFLQGYLQGKPLNICCQQGNQIASIVIQHKGAIVPPEATSHLSHLFNSVCGE